MWFLIHKQKKITLLFIIKINNTYELKAKLNSYLRLELRSKY